MELETLPEILCVASMSSFESEAEESLLGQTGGVMFANYGFYDPRCCSSDSVVAALG